MHHDAYPCFPCFHVKLLRPGLTCSVCRGGAFACLPLVVYVHCRDDQGVGPSSSGRDRREGDDRYRASENDERSKSRKRSRSEERAGFDGEPAPERSRAAPVSLPKQDDDGDRRRDDRDRDRDGRGAERPSSTRRDDRDKERDRPRDSGCVLGSMLGTLHACMLV